ncbi:MAG TPA: hypothetical protein VIF84_06895 [Candidatus Limnocylindrales bacterium]|jgi:DNA polymerase-3 subunit delta'
MVAGYRTLGQPAALAVIARAVATERPPHAVLVAGPARVGKTTLALDLAAGLLCLSPDPSARPCRACSACRKVEHENHPDVHRLAPAGAGNQIRIDQARALIGELALLPLEGRVRVAVVSQAQRLNPDAQHALLKTLEEPPTGAVLVLCADDETLLLDTVRSRCARIRAAPVAAPIIAELLVGRDLADAPTAAAIARIADGRPGLAVIYAASPEIVLRRAGLARTLLDLASAGRRQRIAAAPALLADASVLAEVADRPSVTDRTTDAAAAESPAARPTRARPEPPHEPVATDRSEEAPAAPVAASARTAPAARRAASLALIEAWRDVARDLIVVMAGGPVLVRDLDLLEDLERAAAGLTLDEVATFLARLDGLAAAVDAYANADLVVDVLLLAWPRARLAA